MKSYVGGYKVYKPTKAGSGSALQIAIKEDYSCAFSEVTSQIKDSQAFDWENKIVMKLGKQDILSLIDILEWVRTSEYKAMLRNDPENFDLWMASVCTAKDKSLLNLFHANATNGSTSSLVVKPNGAKYGGGFNMSFFRKMADGKSLSHRINITPVEALGIIYALEKILVNECTSADADRSES